MSKKQTATQVALEKGAKERERQIKADAKKAEKQAAKQERAAKLEEQKAATAKKHADAKSAISYNTYSVIKAAGNTPFASCKRFYVLMQAAVGGSLCTVLTDILGADKREFAEIYADRVRVKFEEKKNAKNYTDFLVWTVLWEDLKQFTVGKAERADRQTAKAIEELRKAVEERALARKAEKEAKEAANKSAEIENIDKQTIEEVAA